MTEKETRIDNAARAKKRLLRISIAALIIILTNLIGFQARQPVATAAPTADVGYQDMYYKTSGVSEPTAQKPQSKLWFNDGKWWGDFYSKDAGEYRIYALDWQTQIWSDTGVALDDREKSWADVLWDGTYLYVASGTTSGPGRLYRYTYDGNTYHLSPGFPVQVTGDSMEALVFAKDSTGTLWITYTKGGKVYVAHSNGSDSIWVAPYVLPVAEATGLFNDDISTIVAYEGHIGVMWSNQTLKKIVFAAHVDGAPDNQWVSASTYTLSADDHLNIKSLQADAAGNLFAVVKTSFSSVGEPGIILLACTAGDCTTASNWQSHVVFYRTTTTQRTRPILLLDTDNRDLYVFMATSSGGPVRYQQTSIDAISFPQANEKIFIDFTGGLSDPTSTKQNLTRSTGLVVAASDSNYYYHNCMTLTGATECPDPNSAPMLNFSATSYNVTESGVTVTLEVQRIGSLVDPVTVDYTTSGGTAVAGQDYTAASQTLTLNAGEPGGTFTIDILNDALDELDETFIVTLSNPTNGAELDTDITATITITDDDDPPTVQFSASNYDVDEGADTATIDVTLSAPSALQVNVDYATADDTAVAGEDYTATTNTLSFAAGETSKSFTIPILEDTIDEADETATLTLSNTLNATLDTPSEATLTILDNEAQPTVQFATVASTVNENDATAEIVVTLSHASGDTISVDYATTGGGTATPGDDYLAANSTLTFAPGETSHSFNISIFDNSTGEPSETVELALSNPQKAEMGTPDSAVLTILDDDIEPLVQFTTPTVSVDEDAGTVAVEVTLSDASANTITVDYAVSGGTAVTGQDFEPVSGTLTFNPGVTSKQFTITVVDDLLSEGKETVQLTLSNAVNAAPGAVQTLEFVINDNDSVHLFLPMILTAP